MAMVRVRGSGIALGTRPGAGALPWRGEADGTAVAEGGDPHLQARHRRLDHQAAADYDPHVARRLGGAVSPDEEHEITGLYLAGGNPRSPQPLLLRGTRDEDACRPVGHHHQAWAIERIWPGATPLVRLAELGL